MSRLSFVCLVVLFVGTACQKITPEDDLLFEPSFFTFTPTQRTKNQPVPPQPPSQPSPKTKKRPPSKEDKKVPVKKQTTKDNQKVSINVQQAKVSHVLYLLARTGKQNMVLDDEIQGKISLHVENAPWKEVLDIVLQQQSLQKIVQRDILRILPTTKLEKERQALFLARKKAAQEQMESTDLEPLQTQYITVHYAQAEELSTRLAPLLSPRGKITPDPRTNLLVVFDCPTYIEKIRTALSHMDKPQRQVMIEARLVYATDIFQRNLGLKWGMTLPNEAQDYLEILGSTYSRSLNLSGLNLFPNPGGFSLAGSMTKLGGDMFTLDLELQLGEQDHTAKTISAPRIATLNNHQARISQGIMIKVTTETGEGKAPAVEYKPAILMLEVRPQITPDNKLILDLHIQDDAKTTGADIDTRSATTRLLVDDGQTIVIGGIQKIEYQKKERSVPGLKKIPVLGWLFKNSQQEKKKAELLVFIRPKILN